MGALETIRSHIPDFSGHDDLEKRRIADEQVRAFVGERLVELPEAVVGTFSPDERALYDRLLLRSEFLNQPAFHVFEERPTPERTTALLEADAELLEAAKNLETAKREDIEDILQRLEEAFDKRDAAMTKA